QGGATVVRDLNLIQEGTEGGTYEVTVRLIGDFRTDGVDDQVDIFAGSPTGFRVKTVSPGNTAGTDYSFYLPDGNWMVGVGPAMPQGPMAGPPLMPDWMPPMPISLFVSGGGTSVSEKSATANDGTIVINLGTQSVSTVSGQVVDGSGSGISNAEVFAYQPNGGFGGANTKTASDGTFTLKVPVTGMYSLGAFKPGLPEAKEKAINVQGNVSGLTIKMIRPANTISGKVLNANGNGVGFVPVWAYDDSIWQHSSTVTDATGNYILYVNDGDWTVETDLPGFGWMQYSEEVAVSGSSVSGINLEPDTDTDYFVINGNVNIDGQNMTYMPIRAVEFDVQGNYLGREYGAMTDSNGDYEITVKGPEGVETQKLYRVDIWTPEYGEVAANNLNGNGTPGEVADDAVANNPANIIITDSDLTNVNVLVATADLNDVTIIFDNKADYSEINAFVNIEGINIGTGNPTGFYKSLMIEDISGPDKVVKLPDGDYHFFFDIPGSGQFIPQEGKHDAATTPGYIDVSDASADSNTATVALPDQDDVTFVVTVNGNVSNGGNVEDAWVWVVNPETGFHKGTSTDASGNYSLTVPVLSSGNYMIGVDKPGYMSSEPDVLDLTDTTPADGVADNTQDFTISLESQVISGYLFADAVGGTDNSRDSGEEVPNGWVHAEEINTGTMAHAPVDGSGFYSLGVINGDWKVYGTADGYLETQYSTAGLPVLITVSGGDQTNKDIKLNPNTNWQTKSKNKPMVPASGGVIDDTGTGGTGVKMTVPANALGSSSSSGTVKMSKTSAVAKTNSATPFGGQGQNITANDNSGQPITNLNDFVDLEFVVYKADIDAEVTAGNLADFNRLKAMQVGYFDSTLDDWVLLSTTRTAYYKTLLTDTEWKSYEGDNTRTGFQKFIDDALIDGTFTAFEDYKLIFKSATNHFTIFGVTTPTDGVAPAAPTGLSQTSGSGSSVVLDWDDNAEGDLLEYEIYRSTSTGVNKTSTQVNSSQVSSSTFTDTSTSSWTSYFYTVTAADDSGNESDIATEIQVCSNKTVSNGTVAADCVITCAEGYDLSGNSCRRPGGGGGGGVSTPPQVTTPTIDLTSPSASSSFQVEDQVEITWSVGGAGIDSVELAYSLDGGLTSTVLSTNMDPDETYAWTLPTATEGNTVMLMVEAFDTGKSDLARDSLNFTVSSLSLEEVELYDTQEQEVFDEAHQITRDQLNRRVAALTQTRAASPVTGETEQVSEVFPGQFITSYGFSSVYYVTENLTRRPFWDATSFFTWGDSWDDVVWVTDATLVTLGLDEPMLPKPGKVLVKIQSDPKVYAVEYDAQGGKYQLRWVPDEATAEGLYGSDWSDYIIDLNVTIFARYQMGDDMSDSEQAGSMMRKREAIGQLINS
ncbi:carboxypeptidase regulatory-like domain-containing protein, partial [Patescibacteria group bacterium]